MAEEREKEERESSIITIQPFKDKPPQEIRVPFSQEEVESIRIIREARHELGQYAADQSGPIRELHDGPLNFLWGYAITNREVALRNIRHSKKLIEYALSGELFCPEKLKPTLLKIEGEIDKLLPEEKKPTDQDVLHDAIQEAQDTEEPVFFPWGNTKLVVDKDGNLGLEDSQ